MTSRKLRPSLGLSPVLVGSQFMLTPPGFVADDPVGPDGEALVGLPDDAGKLLEGVSLLSHLASASASSLRI